MNYIRNLADWSLGIDFSKITYVMSGINSSDGCRGFEIHFDGGATLYLTTAHESGREFETAWKEYSKDCQMRERVADFK